MSIEEKQRVIVESILGHCITPEQYEQLRMAFLSANGYKAGKVGGPARAKSLSPKRRSEIAKQAALARWNKHV
jgi:hypothetical protein